MGLPQKLFICEVWAVWLVQDAIDRPTEYQFHRRSTTLTSLTGVVDFHVFVGAGAGVAENGLIDGDVA